MRLKMTGLAVLVSALAYLGMTGVAAAASSPSATATAASNVTNTTATIHATITPNGAATNYYFSYGPTSALGVNSPEHTVAVGKHNDAVPVAFQVGGLQTGTTYYYNLTAASTAGSTVTQTVSFKTSGVTPATATTGGTTVNSATEATLTGVVNTQDTNTQYYFQYGPTTAYGYQTATAVATAATAPVPVSYTLPGLAPGSAFHYRLVAVNGPNDTSVGADGSFYTFPDPVPSPRMVQYTTPKKPRRGPFVFTTSGHVINTTPAPAQDACTGTATASFYYRGHLLHRLAMPVGPACQFFGKSTFRSLPARNIKTAEVQVYVRFSGNHYLKGLVLRAENLTLG